MRAERGQQSQVKMPYTRPRLEVKGKVADLTQQIYKDLGGADGIFLLNDDGGLHTIS